MPPEPPKPTPIDKPPDLSFLDITGENAAAIRDITIKDIKSSIRENPNFLLFMFLIPQNLS